MSERTTRESASPYDALFELARLLETQGLEGLLLWRRFVEEGFPFLVGIAAGQVRKLAAVGRLDPAEIASATFVALDQRFLRSPRQGNAIFGKYHPDKGSLPPYLVRAMDKELRHVANRHLRPNRLQSQSVPLDDNLLHTLCAEQDQPLSAVEAAELFDAVNRLPGELRQVVILRYYDGLKPVEIASQLKVGRTTVYDRLELARCQLRTLLQPPG
jgi:RNA polymerase sigma factor (sigma-70 family)